jgi:AcrR family transcriptional regulator
MSRLRERTRRRTRDDIADAALGLFLERGFDAVTVAEVAAAAGVSEKTVFNYFPTKAELVFDAEEDVVGGLERAIRERPPGCSIVTAVRHELRVENPDIGDGSPPEMRQKFRRMMTGSPTLLAHRRQMDARIEERLTAVLAEETGAPPNAPEPFVVAVALVGCLRAGFAFAQFTGSRSAGSERALDLLEAGLADFGVRAQPTEQTERPEGGRP